MRNLRELGFGGLVQTPAPLGPLAIQAMACWYWCGGWNPERWPGFAVFHEVPDWGALIELMQTLREALAPRRK